MASKLKRENERLLAQLARKDEKIARLSRTNLELCNRLESIKSGGRIFSRKQAIHALGISMKTLENWMEARRNGDSSACPKFVKEGGKYRFLEDDISAFKVARAILPWHSDENLRLFSNRLKHTMPRWDATR